VQSSNALLSSIPAANRRVPHISLVFREMWDTAGLPLKPDAAPQIRTGAPGSPQRTWAENDGRSPPQRLFCVDLWRPHQA
jgi:hypothetical protein